MTTNNSLSQDSLVLAIDIGTTSLKAAFVSASGEVFSFKRVEYNSLSLSGSTRQSFDKKDSRVCRSANVAIGNDSTALSRALAIKRGNDTVGAAAWSKAVKSFLPSPLLSDCAAVSVSGNGPTIVSASGATLLWSDCAETDCKPETCGATKNASQDQDSSAATEIVGKVKNAEPENCTQAQKGAPAVDCAFFEKLDVPDAQKKIYQPRLAAFARLFPDEWQASPRLYTSTQWLCNYIEQNAAALGLPQDARVFDAGPDFVAALVGTATLHAGRLCDRAGSSEGLNLCSPIFFEEPFLRTMPSPARDLWNISYLIQDPGSSRQEKVANFCKAFNALKGAAAAHGAPLGDVIMVTGGQALDQQLLQEKADAVGIKVALAQVSDAEILGGTAAAFFRLGKFSSLEQSARAIFRQGKVFEPREKFCQGQNAAGGEGGAQSLSAGGASRSCERSPLGASKACKQSQPQDALPKFYSVPKDLRAIIFDIDSTLYTNAAYAFEQVECQVRRFASLRGITNEVARKMVSDYRKKYARETGGKKVSLSNTLLQFGITIEQSVQWRRELIEPADFLGRDEKLRETLLALGARFKLLCVTNNPILPARKTLQALGVDDLIEVLVGLDSCNLSKPAKEPFELAAREAGVASANIVSVGDRYDLDIAPALELGMGGVLVRGVSDVCKLPELL